MQHFYTQLPRAAGGSATGHEKPDAKEQTLADLEAAAPVWRTHVCRQPTELAGARTRNQEMVATRGHASSK